MECKLLHGIARLGIGFSDILLYPYLHSSAYPRRRGGGRGLCCDRMRWCLNGNSTFDVHSFFPWKSIWCVKTPKRVSFFMWTAAWGKILTIDNLFKKGLSLVGWCCLCRCSRKIVSHLLHHCDIIYALWSEVFSRFGVWWVMPMTISSFLFGGGIGL